MRLVCWLVGCLASQQHAKCTSGTDLIRQFYMLPHWDRSCKSNFLSHPVTVYWHWTNQSQQWPIQHQVPGRVATGAQNFEVSGMTRPGKIPVQTGIKPRVCCSPGGGRLGLVVKADALRAEDPGFQSRLQQDFFGVESYQWLKNWHSSGYPAWRYRVSAGTGRPGVSILWLGEVERLICNFYLSVAARKIVWADPSLRYTSLLLGR